MVTIDKIKQLREETLVSVSECKKALEEAGGSLEKAKEILKKWGKDIAGKRAEKTVGQGIVASYVHPNKRVGVLLELGCETDFVAKGQDFQTLSHELCLQIAAMGEEIPFLEQPWIKDDKKTIKDLLDEYISKIGENIVIKKFSRYQI